MSLGMRHHHKHKKSSGAGWSGILDYIVYAAGILGSVLTLPQVYIIYHYHTAAGCPRFPGLRMPL
jgi:hypothetical protein